MSLSLRTCVPFSLALLCTGVFAEPQALTVISFGGATKQAQDKAYFQPFNASGAGRIVAGEYNGELSKIKAMVDVGHATWDVVEVESPELLRGCDAGLFERLDKASFGDQAQFVPGTLTECGVATYVWSMVMAFNKDKLAKTPTSWADFWNVTDFPGKRGLRKGAKYTLEIALLADGVKPDQLYKVLGTPEGVNRAFAKLDKIKSSIQWWEAGAQPAQWLIAGDVVMSAAYNGRIASAQKEGMNLSIVWPQSLYDPEYWAVVKGSPNKALAERFIAFASQPQAQKVFSENIPYGPVHRQALALLPEPVRQQLPTAEANLAKAQSVDAEFWVDHGEELEEHFNAWAAR
ncbi:MULTISPECIES: ABC transporter substrate-binding protein [Pseudomonas]|uniref:ABC transporter substrate-binding protein n=1 Tax=Pseudomonas TaxID=286 RepID=UPI000C884814|nr:MULTISPECIES: ABC transporter substrate-binding protein [Pseudomonas]PMY55112.1 spermidine/putrescine ABC transporter substrate-binding protein [Pseudomonas sp. FW305-53]PMY88076.1 spermidine/putrescine ABC transporter substrate-binding protein [Pseudomonas sp. FW303-C2]PMY90321.1 spermidine/putrescine ABC transporter substrate-binding protein [Pseudomonas sp. FW305-62]PNA44914.1 spermidine/putrescine ABC transporter substrate-binding protein [Pseudomonas sp. FW306-2-2C-A10BC]PNA87442.1 spe